MESIRRRWCRVLLLNDLKQYAVDYLTGHQAERLDRMVLKAIRDGLNAISNAHRWPELFSLWRVPQTANYATGTISSTDGKTITLASGTWPSWSVGGILEVASTRSLVRYRNSDTVIVLHDDFNHLVSITAGTVYKLYRV